MRPKFRSMLVCVLLVLVCAPSIAHAEQNPIYRVQSGWNDEPYEAWTFALDQFSAACNFFGVDGDTLNTAQRAFLLQNDTWLRFYDAVTARTDAEDYAVMLSMFPYYNRAGQTPYYVNVDGSYYGYAQTLLMQVFSGEVTTGGGDYPVDGNLVFVRGWTENPNNPSNFLGVVGTAWNPTFWVNVNALNQEFISVVWVRNGNTHTVYTMCGSVVPIISNWTCTLPAGNYSLFTGKSARAVYAGEQYERAAYVSSGSPSSPPAFTDHAMQQIPGTVYGYVIGAGETTTNIPTEPDPQPDPPIQPPDPGTDVPTVDPPTWPTIDFPDITIHGAPITITWPTIADNADYTDLLREIIKTLQKIGDLCADIVNDMDEHCEHLQSAIKDAAEYIVDNLELGIDPDLDDLVRGIDNAWRKITATIKEQVKWLADQLDYDFTVTLDLDKIEQYLRRIISKMGGGTSKPDPTTDPFSWGDWLNDLWTKIFTALQIALPDELGELLELFDILKTKFPFSVPFDLIAIVALFDHAPVTPVFELPYPMLLATGVGYDTVTIDCSGWNSTMVMVRDLEVVLFTAYLISRTQWAMDAIDPKKGK